MRFAYVIVISLSLGLLGLTAFAQGGQEEQNIPELKFDRDVIYVQTEEGEKHWFDVEMANNRELRARGLMYRRTMRDDAGMLFLFPQAHPRAFWMKNTYIPLDIIYFDDVGRIVSIAANTTPLDETPVPSLLPARFVLEINAGQAALRGLEEGDFLCHPAVRLHPQSACALAAEAPDAN